MSFLENRELFTSWLGHEISGSVSEGCPQGGVLSPLLWSLVVDGLLRVLSGMGIRAIGYADDIAILARGAYEEVLSELVQTALDKAAEWRSDESLSIQGDETIAMVFTRKYKVKALQEMELGVTRIPHVGYTKYLGMILDKKMSWKRHLEDKCKKAIVTFW